MKDAASEVAYYSRRAAVERAAADRAADAHSAELHRDLARLFEERTELHAHGEPGPFAGHGELRGRYARPSAAPIESDG